MINGLAEVKNGVLLRQSDIVVVFVVNCFGVREKGGSKMKKHVTKFCILVSMFAFLGTTPALAAPAVEASGFQSVASSRLRSLEYLDRGLVAAETEDGIFLSWRFLGDEPDGVSWNIYRKDSGDTDF